MYILGVLYGLGFVLSLFDLSLYLDIDISFWLKFKGSRIAFRPKVDTGFGKKGTLKKERSAQKWIPVLGKKERLKKSVPPKSGYRFLGKKGTLKKERSAQKWIPVLEKKER